VKNIIFIIIILLLSAFSINASLFDLIEWEKVFELNQVSVCMQKDKKVKINFYKAEKTIAGKKAEALYKNILSFDSYPEIFPRTIMFKKVREIENNKYIMYTLVNFKPLKNRDYYLLFCFTKKGDSYIIEWSCVNEKEYPEEKNIIRANYVNGRWIIKQTEKFTTISLEVNNDFEIHMSAQNLIPYEIASTAEMLENIIKYTLKNN
jgi:hypothetical protein